MTKSPLLLSSQHEGNVAAAKVERPAAGTSVLGERACNVTGRPR